MNPLESTHVKHKLCYILSWIQIYRHQSLNIYVDFDAESDL